MKFLKNHLALIIPLAALLFAIESIFLISRTIDNYREKIGSEYAIVLASKEPLSVAQIQNKIAQMQNLEEIDTEEVLKQLSKNISAANFDLIKSSLPYFYKISLENFPSQSELDKIEQNLRSIGGISRIETFSKSHSQIFRLLIFNKGAVMVLSTIVVILSILLMFKQIEVWWLTHAQRMEIMGLLGASSWMKSSLLFKLALSDTIIAALIVSAGIYYASSNPSFLDFISTLGLGGEIFSPLNDSLLLLFIGLVLSLGGVWVISLKAKEQ